MHALNSRTEALRDLGLRDIPSTVKGIPVSEYVSLV
jgi:hypothetical protein